MQRLRGTCLGLLTTLLLAGSTPAVAQDTSTEVATIPIAYITQRVKELPPLSLVDQPTTDNGLMGARVGIDDNNTTGQFTKQKFTLDEAVV
ncbi:MAG TPA: branched-chain amino acid ABC transporter substrate-binding protein, partial [Methylomirabilota bacterium]|nr:branched-chain amino acid ABC transporter substrate-binding protein [Methylomirabilota bacterium]